MLRAIFRTTWGRWGFPSLLPSLWPRFNSSICRNRPLLHCHSQSLCLASTYWTLWWSIGYWLLSISVPLVSSLKVWNWVAHGWLLSSWEAAVVKEPFEASHNPSDYAGCSFVSCCFQVVLLSFVVCPSSWTRITKDSLWMAYHFHFVSASLALEGAAWMPRKM